MFTDNDDSSPSIVNQRKHNKPADTYDPDPDYGEPEVRETHPLDSSQATMLHRTLMGHYTREMARQGEARGLMERDEAFDDHDQYTDEELETLSDRGQAPLVFNVINTAVNWLTGTETRTATDYKILPRRKDGSKHAARKTELFKHVSDANHSRTHWSRAFRDAARVGLGWMETGQNSEDADEPVFDRYESWRNVIYDSIANEMDLSDARYLFRTKWVDVDMAEAYFPDRADMIRRAKSQVYDQGFSLDGAGDDAMDSVEAETGHGTIGVNQYDGSLATQRDRVRLFECWFVMPTDGEYMKGGDFTGQLYDKDAVGHQIDLETGRASVISKRANRMYVALFTVAGLLHVQPSPYRHNKFPFTPIWGKRKASTGQPYGLIRGLIDLQRDINKRASKALHILSATKVFVEEGAVEDIEVLRSEAARPDAVIVHKAGRPMPQLFSDTNLAAAHAELMSRDIMMVQQVSGITDENLGRRTNAVSGVAIERRQDQGSLASAFFFDNLRHAKIIHGEKLLCNIEQFYTEERTFRITNSRGNPTFISINDDNPEDDNWIGRTRADFIISEADWRATIRQANTEALFEMLSKLAPAMPEFVAQTLDLMIEASDVPNREEIVKRIRQITGQTDPDADPDNPDDATLEIMAMKQQNAAIQAEAMALEKRTAEAKASEIEAKAAKIASDIDMKRFEAINKSLANLQAAISAAMNIQSGPAIAATADIVMAEAEARAVPPAPPPAAMPAPIPETLPQ